MLVGTKGTTRIFMLDPSRPNTIGSGPDATVAIRSPSIHERHAIMASEGNAWHLLSVEGQPVEVNGRLVDADSVPLSSGDLISIGETVDLRFELNSTPDLPPSLRFLAASASDVGGTRRRNEDSVIASARLCAVADGVGGGPGGQLASALALQVLNMAFEQGATLIDAAKEASDAVTALAERGSGVTGLGTTLTAVAIETAGMRTLLSVTHVGDSRAYLVHGGALRRLTEDHRAQVGEGQYFLTRLVGQEATAFETTRVEAEAGDRLLLVTDGVTDVLDDVTLAALVTTEERERVVKAVLATALHAGSKDNISVVVADIGESTVAPVPIPLPSEVRRERALVVAPRASARRADLLAGALVAAAGATFGIGVALGSPIIAGAGASWLSGLVGWYIAWRDSRTSRDSLGWRRR
ncbi:MAG: protein phosphatase 2C domain-containing protein [Actinomycetota bacterium]|nr:protein phosphatase 2C domain-containing protein [Actinomycetota bacterium]